MITDEIREELFRLQDVGYRDFQSKLIPTVDKDTVIGVRLPELRKLAKQYSKREDVGDFLDVLPHPYYDENQLHAFLISEIKEYDTVIREIDRFLPFVDNWAVCDTLSPKVFSKHKTELLSPIARWINSDRTYTVRFGIKMLMAHYLNDAFDPRYLETVAAIRSEEYYVNMMIAWYFATALAKQYEATIPFIEQRRLAPRTHNKAIQKALESYRVSAEQKDYLRGLKIKVSKT